MNILLASYLILFPQLVFQPAGNELAWLDMPTNTVQERTAREAARKNWAKKKRILDAMARGAARKQRIVDPNRLARQQYYYRGSQQRGSSQRYGSQRYYQGSRYRYINIPTPTGTVRYLVPY